MSDVTIVQAPRAEDLPDTLEGVIARDLVTLTEYLVVTKGVQHEGGALGGRYGYGVVFENDVFQMHPFCWCGREEGPNACPWCVDQTTEPGDADRKTPHFRVKGTPIAIRWYKWIGRSMEIEPATLTGEAWREAFRRVEASL